jgi:hypothetical protein
MKKCLDGDEIPKAGSKCDYCKYINSVKNATK